MAHFKLAADEARLFEWNHQKMIVLPRKLTVPGKMLALLCAATRFTTPESLAEPPVTTMDPLVVTGNVPAPSEENPPATSTVDSVTAETIRDKEIIALRQAVELIPNVSISESDSARASSFSVRGSHEITFHEFTGGRTGVGYYLDDIPCADAYGRDLTLFDVERLSFYKGPHGTAFGVPGSMGLFEVVTKAPGPELEGNASYTYGSNEFNQLLAHVSGPILPNLFFGLDGIDSRDNGRYEDRLTGDDYGKHELTGGRMRLRWLPTDSLEINLTVGLDHHDDDPSVYVPSATTKDRYVLATSPDAYATGGQNYEALQAIWKGEDWQLKSITSRRDSSFDDSDDALLLEVFDPFSLPRKREQDVSTWTQEIRLESVDPDALWRWRTGLFFSSRDSHLDHFILGLGPWEGTNEFRYEQEDYAIYGELTRVIGGHLELTSGLRLQTSRDHTTSGFVPTSNAVSLGGAMIDLENRDDFNGVLPMAAASWKWSDAHRSYVRFSTGLQPGGLAVASAGSTDYDSECSFHYELGHNSSFRDDTVRLHGAAFYTDYRDYQSFQFNPAGQTIFNADRAHAVGVEGELRVLPCEGFELFAGAGWTKATFDDFESPVGDYSGNRINKIPAGTVNLGGAWRASWGGMARLDWRYVGKTWFDEGNTVKQDGYSLVDARIGYERGGYGIYLFSNNLLGEEYYSHTYLFQGAPAATPGPPRMVGVELRADF